MDAALDRLGSGAFGMCETCHEAIEDELLQADPLVRFCMPHLSDAQVRALQEDLQLASLMQELGGFRSGTDMTDDLSLMVLRREL